MAAHIRHQKSQRASQRGGALCCLGLGKKEEKLEVSNCPVVAGLFYILSRICSSLVACWRIFLSFRVRLLIPWW